MPAPHSLARPTIAIIGGGLSGAAVAWHIAQQTAPQQAQILVIEPRAGLGQGLAYSTPDPEHRLNVPDHKMTLRTDRPEDFRTWLASPAAPLLPPGSATTAGEIFAPRAVFGRYVAHHLAPLLASGAIRHLRARAEAASRTGPDSAPGGWQIRLDDGQQISAQVLVLAVSHPPPGLPRELAALAGHDGLITDSTTEGALDRIHPDHRVMILGSGLTGADIAASLRARNHRGRIHMLSRHGRRSQPHGPAQAATAGDFSQAPATTARGLLRRIRRALAQDAAAGLTWHAVFDQLRQQGPQIWAALPLTERNRLVRHLRGLWDVHRFRIAPQTHAALEALIAARRLLPLAGRITLARPRGEGFELSLRARQTGEALTLAVDRIVLATGPGHAGIIAANPLLSDMARSGLITADALRLGLATTLQGEALDQAGQPQPDLLIAGPLARAAVGELMGVPEVTAWAEQIAARAAARVTTPA